MRGHDTIVIGASAGSIRALIDLVERLPSDLPAAVFIVLHIPAEVPSQLAKILSHRSRLPVSQASNGAKAESGRIYVAPPDQHLLLENSHMTLVRSPKENLHRPSIDVLFRSAARVAGARTIGVVLTGARDDGVAGMRAIKRRGGIAIVQDPLEAQFPSMPLSVMRAIQVDYSLPVSEIGQMLATLAHKEVSEEGGKPVPDEVRLKRGSPNSR